MDVDSRYDVRGCRGGEQVVKLFLIPKSRLEGNSYIMMRFFIGINM